MAFRTALERRHRKSARIALYFSLVASSLVAVVLVETIGSAVRRAEVLDAESQEWAYTDWEEDPAVKVLQGYLRVDTNWQTGSELAGAQYLAGLLEEAGIEPHLERLGEDKANLWAILEGEERGAVVLHHHIDVEPIHEPEKWDYPPFAGHIKPPWIYGRGVFDMKSLAVAQMVAVERLLASGRKPYRSILLLATGSEESGSALGTRWMLREHQELFADAWVVLTEGGVVEALNRERIKYWGIEFAQKWFAPVVACHPRRERLAEMEQDLSDLGQPLTGLALIRDVATFVSHYASTRQRPSYRDTLEDPRAFLGDPVRFRRLPSYLRALFRNELHPLRLVEDPEGGWRLEMVLHLLPGADPRAALEQLLPEWLTHGVTVEVGSPLGGFAGTDPGHPAFGILAESILDRHPGAPVGPHFLSWVATDARFFRGAGLPTFGFSPFVVLNTDTLQIDSANERMGLPGFVDGVDLMAQTLENL
ncbi:MAG: M20/M25/M40 family metallo-hydrolase, partial [Acidobacteria bacterium]|nr:M20/M25/M40 family metallo-hydrolase [Acidobacteriota bacterium]